MDVKGPVKQQKPIVHQVIKQKRRSYVDGCPVRVRSTTVVSAPLSWCRENGHAYLVDRVGVGHQIIGRLRHCIQAVLVIVVVVTVQVVVHRHYKVENENHKCQKVKFVDTFLSRSATGVGLSFGSKGMKMI